MQVDNREHSNWDLIATTNKEEIKETKKINAKFLESLTAEIRANPEVGEGLASKVIKCIDTSQMDTKVLKDFISSLTDTQTLRGQFCAELGNKNLFVVELFNKFQGSDAELILSLIDAVPHLSETELNQLLKKAMKTEKIAIVEELLKKEFPIDNTLFHLACEKGMKSVVMHMLEKDRELLEFLNDAELTPLAVAIEADQESVALALIKAGANVYPSGKEELIHLACERGMGSVVMNMLDQDKELLEMKDYRQKTPLMVALSSGQLALALSLIEAGANVSSTQRESIIHLACEHGMESVVMNMLDQDKELLEKKNNKQMTPLMTAINSGQEVLALALIKAGANVRSIEGRGVMHLACEKGLESVFRHILETDKELVNSKNEGGLTPLMAALLGGNEAIASTLLDQPADASIQSLEGINALHAACLMGIPNMVTKILDQNKELLNSTDNENKTPLMHAFNFLNPQKESIALMLLERGADASIGISHLGKYREGPIHNACQWNMEAVIDKIIEQDREQLNVKDNAGRTPIMHAILQKNDSIANKLIGSGADLKAVDLNGKTVLSYAYEKGMEEIISKIVEQDNSLLEIKESGYTLLHRAIEDRNEKMALHLISLGARLDTATNKGELAIHLACHNSLTELASEMIKKDSNLLNIKNKEGLTPLMRAMDSGDGENETANMLINLGADLKLTNNKGFTVLHRVCELGDGAMAYKMIEKDPDLAYIYPVIGRQAKTPLQSAIANFHEGLALKLIRLDLAELTSIQPLLTQARYSYEAVFIIKNNLDKIIDPAQNAPGANPLKAALLLGDADFFQDMRVKLTDQFFEHLNKLEGAASNFIENNILKVEPKHFAKGSLITEVPATVDFELDKLEDFFDAINFTNPTVPGYKNPLTLLDEGLTTNPVELKGGINLLVRRVKAREPYLGTPQINTPELTEFYDKFEAYLKNIGQLIEGLDDPSEKATHLIDIAIIGLHCGGKIGEAASLYRILSGQLAEGYETQVCDVLRDYRLGIIEDWATKGRGTTYEVHRFNHYMYLLGKALHLPEADSFTKPDSYASITLTPEEALSKFSEIYYPSALIDFTQDFILDSLKIKSTREACVDWIRDHVPADWQKEKYTGILNKIRALEEKGVSRQEIRSRIQREEGLFFAQGDQDPIEAIKLHRQRDYNNNVPKVEEWRKDFYNPIFAEIEVMGETANFTEYLTSKKITKKPITSQADAKAAVIERRRKDFFFNKPEENDWNEAFYGDLFKAVEGMQSRDDIRRALQEKGVELEQDRDFENLLEQVRGLEYLSTVFEYEQDKVTGIDRVAVRDMLKQMEVITDQL